MPTSNEELLNAAVRHQVKLLRFSTGEAKRAIKLLDLGDKELADLLTTGLTDFSQARVQGLLGDVGRLRAALLAQLNKQVTESIHSTAEVEAEWEKTALEAAAPIDISFNSVAPQTLKGIVSAPIQGIKLEGWLENMHKQDVRRIEQAVQLGVLEGQTTPQIVKRVLDNGTAVTKRNAEALVRTAVNNTSNNARNEVWKANSDIVSKLRWTATLDGRTSEVCRARDGELYPVDSGPRPPAHFNCRSLMVAVMDGIALVGDRPTVRDTRTRKVRETDFRAEAKAEAGDAWKGMSESQRKAAIKARRDKWAADVIGEAPAKTTYDDWLRKQPKEFQDEVLGKAKADIFRKGWPLNKFVDENGKSYSLDDLKQHSKQDGLDVVQPGVGLKAKSYLQQGMTSDEVHAKILEEFPNAKTTPASIASYKSELKKLGALDQLKGQVAPVATGDAMSIQYLVDTVDGSLTPGLKNAIGGQWANVVEDLQGAPGAYGTYKAGKGVMLSAKALEAVPATQTQQVISHELGHLLHKQHGLQITDWNFFKVSQLYNNSGMSDLGKKAYAYYFSHPDEFYAEAIAQAISPSPLTSQGLSAIEFNKIFQPVIEQAKKDILTKFPTPAPSAPKPMAGPPVVPGEVAGKHTTVGGLAKALLQQGFDDEQVLAAVLKEFPTAKTGQNSIKSYKSELKKAGLLPGKDGSVVVPTKIAVTVPAPAAAEVAAAAPQAAAASVAGPVPLPVLTTFKAEVEKLFNQGVLNNQQVVDTIKGMFSATKYSSKQPDLAAVASWKTNWKKNNTLAATKAAQVSQASAATAAKAGPTTLPKLANTAIGPYAQKAANDMMEMYANGGLWSDASPILQKHFGSADLDKGKDLWELAVHKVDTAKAAGKPYLDALYKAQPSSFSAKSSYSPAPKSNVDMTPTSPATNPRQGMPPPPRFTAEQRKAGIERYHHMDTQGIQTQNNKQKAAGLPELTPEEYSAVRGYTSNVAFSLNKMLRDGKYASDLNLQAFVEAAQSGMQKMAKHNAKEILNRGVSIAGHESGAFFSKYFVGAVVEEDSFLSTSFGGKAAFDRNVIFKFTHKNGIKIDEFSHYRGEREVLLAPGTRLRIVKVEKGVNGKMAIVHAEEID